MTDDGASGARVGGVNLPEALSRVVSERFSCRGFRPDPVPEEVIRSILALAQRSPSWCNTQPWELVVCSRSQTDAFRSALLDHVDAEPPSTSTPDIDKPAGYTGRRLERRRACGWSLYESVGVTRGDRAGSARQARENFAFFGAPHTMIVTTPRELGTYGAVDCGLFLATFLYAAQSHGVGTVAQAAIANHAPFVREYFDLDDDVLVLCGVAFGYPDPSHPANGFRTTRADIDEVVTWTGEWDD